jgi:large subunit ribosomal protein L9
MEIILTENVEGLGTIGDQVKVKPGYGRNYLVPRGLAVVANTRNVKELEHQKRQMERKMQKVTQAAELQKKKVESVTCVLALRAGEDGKLFGSVTTMEIGAKLADAGVEVDRKKSSLTSRSSHWANTKCRSSSMPASSPTSRFRSSPRNNQARPTSSGYG